MKDRSNDPSLLWDGTYCSQCHGLLLPRGDGLLTCPYPLNVQAYPPWNNKDWLPSLGSQGRNSFQARNPLYAPFHHLCYTSIEALAGTTAQRVHQDRLLWWPTALWMAALPLSYVLLPEPMKAQPVLTFLLRSSTLGTLFLMASWMTWICMDTADSTASSSRLNSSKQPHAPHLTSPMKIRPIDFTSIPWL